MHQVLEALIDESGRVFLAEQARFTGTRRALVIVLDEGTPSVATGTLSEGSSRYRIDRPLGAGGMGQAFVGTDIRTNRPVCIKRLRAGVRGEHIAQEWHSLSRVDSRYVVRFLDRYEQAGALHLVMELIDGPTLADRLRMGLPRKEIIWLGLALMRGVAAFHQLDVIHCDLKPQNILIQDETLAQPGEPGWTPKIIDFGLAVLDRRDADGNLTAEGRVAGTPAYMAPEQVNGLVLSPACDVYAVGLILWEAFTGRRAFAGDSYAILAAKAAQTAGLQIAEWASDVPSVVCELVERCTHPHPGHRPSAAEAAELLEQCG